MVVSSRCSSLYPALISKLIPLFPLLCVPCEHYAPQDSLLKLSSNSHNMQKKKVCFHKTGMFEHDLHNFVQHWKVHFQRQPPQQRGSETEHCVCLRIPTAGNI